MCGDVEHGNGNGSIWAMGSECASAAGGVCLGLVQVAISELVSWPSYLTTVSMQSRLGIHNMNSCVSLAVSHRLPTAGPSSRSTG